LISVVVVARNEGDRLARTVGQFAETLPRRSEIVVVDDGSDDDSIERLPADRRILVVRGRAAGVARARNLGARRASGQMLVFSDGHMDVDRGWWEPLAERAARRGVGGAAPAISSITRPDRIGHGLRFSGADLDIDWLYRADRRQHRAPLIPWCCTAMSREVFDATGGFDEAMQAIGSVDNEMSLRLWLLGYELWVVPTVVAAHLFRRKKPFARTWAQALHNRTRLALVHFDPKRIARFVRAYRNDSDFPVALATAATADIAGRRRQIARARLHDAEWYFDRFNAHT
jgi:GT2 family glycosyltransferase